MNMYAVLHGHLPEDSWEWKVLEVYGPFLTEDRAREFALSKDDGPDGTEAYAVFEMIPNPNASRLRALDA